MTLEDMDRSIKEHEEKLGGIEQQVAEGRELSPVQAEALELARVSLRLMKVLRAEVAK